MAKQSASSAQQGGPIAIILSVTIGQWAASTFGPVAGLAVVNDPTKVNVQFDANPSEGEWSVTVAGLASVEQEVKIDAAWLPVGGLLGPIRIVEADNAGVVSRIVTRDGGVPSGKRIDPTTAGGFVRDRIVVAVPSGGTIRLTGKVAPCEAADLDGSGTVDGRDVAQCLGEWGTPSLAADIDKDGTVGGSDLASILAQWSTK